MASELFIRKYSTKRYEEHEKHDIKICSSATLYKQKIGKEYTLYCKTIPLVGNRIKWTFGQKTRSNEHIYKFRLTERNIGTYFCYVEPEDGEVSVCSCDVTTIRRHVIEILCQMC